MNRRRGSLLVMTLWMVTILGALSVAVARYLSTEVRLTRYRLARQEAKELAHSGVSLALVLLQQDPTPEDWSDDLWATPQEISPAQGRRLTVTITDEERKLNVNTATAAQLSSPSLMGDLALAQTIVDYADADAPPDPREDQPPHYAKNSPITVLDELNDIPGLAAESFEVLAAFTTPFTLPLPSAAGGPLNLNTALPEVLEAVGLLQPTIDAIVQYRSGPRHFVAGAAPSTLLEGQAPLDDDQRTLVDSPLFTVASQAFLVVSEGVVESPDVRVRVQAVIQRNPSPGGLPKIIAWREG